ncbi:hypothetical protein VTJ04DRAFT_713 [Mycothermus thermophilus]|uniref:uncharacterized protein n=1 Tax=Humicola insolens TaxID=85995 RepID=UPI003742465C
MSRQTTRERAQYPNYHGIFLQPPSRALDTCVVPSMPMSEPSFPTSARWEEHRVPFLQGMVCPTKRSSSRHPSPETKRPVLPHLAAVKTSRTSPVTAKAKHLTPQSLINKAAGCRARR